MLIIFDFFYSPKKGVGELETETRLKESEDSDSESDVEEVFIMKDQIYH